MPCSCKGEGECLHPGACEFFCGTYVVVKRQESCSKTGFTKIGDHNNQTPLLRPDFGDSGLDDDWVANM